MTKTIKNRRKPFPTQERLRELFDRVYDEDGTLYFVNKTKRQKSDIGHKNYGYEYTTNRGFPSEHKRKMFCVDGYVQQIALWNYIYEYGEYDRTKYTLDHIDRNHLNDHHSNLRIATRSQQSKNRNNFGTSQYIGVSWAKRYSKWQVVVSNVKKSVWVGFFDNEEEAAIAADRAALMYQGSNAILNFFPSLTDKITKVMNEIATTQQ